MRFLTILALGVTFPCLAFGQSTPGFTYGQVPTASQWNSYFAAKQDTLGYTPLNQAGGTMTGPLRTTASTSSAAGFSMLPGIAPNVPNNGDFWVTSTGLYYRAGNVTYGPVNSGSVIGPSTSVVGNVATFGNTSGTLIQDGGKSLPSGSIVGTTDSQTLTNKTFVAPVLGTPASVTLTNGTGLPTTGLTGTLQAAQAPALTGDVTSSAGSLTTTVGRVNGVTYPSAPSTNTVPVVTGSNTVTYQAVPNAALANSSVSVNGKTCTLGSSCAIVAQMQTFIASGTFTTPVGSTTSTVYRYTLTAAGGGSGGAASGAAAGGGGGAGQTAIGTFTGLAAGTSVTVTIGTAGTAGSSGGGNGGNGGDSSIAATGITTITVIGGAGGSGTASGGAPGGPGGSGGSGGVLSVLGGSGGSGFAATGVFAVGGDGGTSYWGGGGTVTSNGAGNAGRAYGSGASGASGAGGAVGGGAGAGGVAVIEWVL